MRRGESWAWAVALAVLALLALPGAALAQATRTWVSGVGNDADPCSRTSPCKTFAGAFSKTAAGGEIDALDSGGFGALTITKSITISGVGVNAGVLVAGTNGINVDGAGIHVVLDHINFQGLDSSGVPADQGLTAIGFEAGASLRVIGGTINNFADDGILDQSTDTNSKLIVDDVNIGDNVGDGVLVSPAHGTAELFDDEIENNGAGLVASATTGGASVVATGSTVADNGGDGVTANGADASVSLADDVITGNGLGLDPKAGGKIVESGPDNTLLGNTTNGSPTSTVGAAVGPAGAQGPQGKQGKAGEVELVTCKTVTETKKVHRKRKKVKVEKCTGKLVSGKVKFTVTGSIMRATLSRGDRVYAAGSMAVQRGVARSGVMTLERALARGSYRLVLWKGSRPVSSRTVRIG